MLTFKYNNSSDSFKAVHEDGYVSSEFTVSKIVKEIGKHRVSLFEDICLFFHHLKKTKLKITKDLASYQELFKAIFEALS